MLCDDLGGGERGREAQEGGDIGIHMADHAVVQQKPTQHCEAISLQLNEIKLCWVFAAARSLGARGS